MFKAIIIAAAACMLVYLLRRNFRRAWYVLRTGDDHPDWEKLGGDYFIAPWGGGKQKTGGSEYTHSMILAFPGHALGRQFPRKTRKGSVAVVATACVNRKAARRAAWV